MGRYVRSVIADLASMSNVAVTLLVRNMRHAAAYRAIAGDVDVAPLADAGQNARFSVVWYPWNGMRFSSHAPAVLTVNDDFAFRYPARDWIGRRREQQPIRRGIANADRLLTISGWSRATLIERFNLDPRRIDVIPLEPDPFFCPGNESSPYLEPFVLAVGTGEERKNIPFLLAAFRRAFPNAGVRLVVVGALDKALCRANQSLPIALTTLTAIDDFTLRRLYRTAAAVAVPSLAEGFGLIAAEAQACGAPVIASNSSALPEAVGDTGLLIDPTDGDAWSATLRAVVSDESCNARYRAQSRIRWPRESPGRTTQAILALLERAIDEVP